MSVELHFHSFVSFCIVEMNFKEIKQEMCIMLTDSAHENE